MSYSKKSVAEAKDIIVSRRNGAEADFERRRSEAVSRIPELSPILRGISSTGARIMSAALSHTLNDDVFAEIRGECERLCDLEKKMLVSAGFPSDYLAVRFTCPKCSDTGYVGVDMCECMKKEIVRLESEGSGLGALIGSQTFDNFDLSFYGANVRIIEYNLKLLKDFAENFGSAPNTSWLLYGPTGLGKTHLSTAVAGTLINNGYSVVYESVRGILQPFEARRFENDLTSNPAERFGECDLLIIDDLGTEVINQFTLSCLYSVIDRRIVSGRSTIINTNLSQNELRDRYNDRITSRIFGEFKILIFTGEDIRQQKLVRKLNAKG